MNLLVFVHAKDSAVISFDRQQVYAKNTFQASHCKDKLWKCKRNWDTLVSEVLDITSVNGGWVVSPHQVLKFVSESFELNQDLVIKVLRFFVLAFSFCVSLITAVDHRRPRRVPRTTGLLYLRRLGQRA